jgi:hypothetical protein
LGGFFGSPVGAFAFLQKCLAHTATDSNPGQ